MTEKYDVVKHYMRVPTSTSIRAYLFELVFNSTEVETAALKIFCVMIPSLV